MAQAGKAESWVGKFDLNGWSVRVRPALTDLDHELLMHEAPTVSEPMTAGPAPWVELLHRLFPEHELELQMRPSDLGPGDAEEALEQRAMLQSAGLIRTAMGFFARTVQELLAEMEYQASEFEAGRMPLNPVDRPDPDVPPRAAPTAERGERALGADHPLGEGCPLPRNAEWWAIVSCPCGARYRLYPPGWSAAAGSGGWARIDV